MFKAQLYPVPCEKCIVMIRDEMRRWGIRRKRVYQAAYKTMQMIRKNVQGTSIKYIGKRVAVAELVVAQIASQEYLTKSFGSDVSSKIQEFVSAFPKQSQSNLHVFPICSPEERILYRALHLHAPCKNLVDITDDEFPETSVHDPPHNLLVTYTNIMRIKLLRHHNPECGFSCISSGWDDLVDIVKYAVSERRCTFTMTDQFVHTGAFLDACFQMDSQGPIFNLDLYMFNNLRWRCGGGQWWTRFKNLFKNRKVSLNNII